MAEENKSEKAIVEITPETIQKSLEILGISEEELQKAESKEAPEAGISSKEEVEKEAKQEGESVETETEEEEEEEKDKEDKKEDKKEEKEEVTEDKEEEKEEKMEKSLELESIKESVNFEDLIKSQSEVYLNEINSLKEMISGLIKTNDDKFQALGILKKGELDTLNEISERVNHLERQPLARKSVISTTAIEKAFDSEENNDGRVRLSLTKNKKEILAELNKGLGIDLNDPSADLSKANNTYLEALSSYESTRQLEKAVIVDLFKKNIIITQ